ncbi:hypothetical protein VC83_09240 [Pseudogymnoascus destructans]|uniref:Glyoxalase-like domain-containing protein n=2 Tax=Pseudogymnoascus destructans TaxID=655981 RepID=L8FXE3_PSED2|nr:uncharacterized protein VC83_09240 [Pseudogymnoascus destructans]ELR05537.1 hypothetical protein GMDG_07457 [Pseudogymnoascus destructans 20631-21]OAF54447.1 hypothetical protein VC83_09240 [Pseudogymnoascus destructans]
MSSTSKFHGVSSSQGALCTRLRQIALVAEDLERAKHFLTFVFGTEVVFIDPRVAEWGLRNFIVAIGGDVIEVVSPIRQNTAAGRLLSKRGDGGYMIIMQTEDAVARRSFIESNNLGKVIYSHLDDDAVCVQYHPKGIKGGVIPELDSHQRSPSNPEPLTSTFSPWHPLGPDYGSYSAGMKRCSHLRLVEVVCRLLPGDTDTEAAAAQWEDMFGVPRVQSKLVFTNGHVTFTPGEKGKPEGIVSVTIAVEGNKNFNDILNRAKNKGLYRDGSIDMVGVKWYLVRDGGDSRL